MLPADDSDVAAAGAAVVVVAGPQGHVVAVAVPLLHDRPQRLAVPPPLLFLAALLIVPGRARRGRPGKWNKIKYINVWAFSLAHF